MVQTSSEAMMPIGKSRCGIFGLLRGGGDRVKADVGEKYVGRSGALRPKSPSGAKVCQSCPQLAVLM